MFRVKTFCIRTGESLSDFDQRVNVLVETLDKKPTCIPEDSVGSNGAWVHTLTVIYEPNPEKRKEYADEASTTR